MTTTTRTARTGRWILAAAAVLCMAPAARAEEALPSKLEGITVTEKLGDRIPMDRPFVDHTGKKVRIGDYFDGTRPLMLTLNYYTCTTLCSIQLNALTRTLRKMAWAPGENFRQVTLSIDHREDAELAAGKRKAHLRALEKGEVDWNFLVGDKESIKAVADAVGFGYRYDPKQNQWAHPAVIVFLSPDGKVTRYLYGLEYAPRDVKLALLEAADGKVGSTVDKLILSCFHYDATEGRYGPYAFGIMRLGGVVTVVVVGVFLVLLWRRERRRARDDRRTAVDHDPRTGPSAPDRAQQQEDAT